VNSFYTREELENIGFKSVGRNVLISKKASIYGWERIVIGNNVRIDDFCILSGNIELKNYIHIAAYSALYGGSMGITINDFANISSRVCVYALSDDYSGETMTNPMIPDEFKHVNYSPVTIERHVIVGSGSTILPGVKLCEGTAVGAMSLVNQSTQPWKIYAGIPIRFIKERSKKLLDLEKAFLSKEVMQ